MSYPWKMKGKGAMAFPQCPLCIVTAVYDATPRGPICPPVTRTQAARAATGAKLSESATPGFLDLLQFQRDDLNRNRR